MLKQMSSHLSNGEEKSFDEESKYTLFFVLILKGLIFFFPELFRPEQDGLGSSNPPESGGQKISIKTGFSGKYCHFFCFCLYVDHENKLFIIPKCVVISAFNRPSKARRCIGGWK